MVPVASKNRANTLKSKKWRLSENEVGDDTSHRSRFSKDKINISGGRRRLCWLV